MPKITEIIPNDIPDWAQKAMEEGQFFNVAINLVEKLKIIQGKVIVNVFIIGFVIGVLV